MSEEFPLKSGNVCVLHRKRRSLMPGHHVLVFPHSQGEPTPEETAEMFQVTIMHARRVSQELAGGPEFYTIIYSGTDTRRKSGWHIHIILPDTRWKKAWFYFVTAWKNLLRIWK